jgi:hypothetical protein
LTSFLPCDKLSDVSTPSRTYQLIEERLDGSLADYDLTGVDVSYETLRSWFAESDAERGAA